MKRRMADPDWGELIRSELDSYVPERLPARFVPGARRQRRPAMVDWRPVAVTIAVLLLGLGFAAVAGGPENLYREVTQMNPSRNVTPTPTVTPTLSPVPTTKAGAAGSPNPARSPGNPAAPALGSNSQSPGADQSPPTNQAVGTLPSPSPPKHCVLGIICLGTIP